MFTRKNSSLLHYSGTQSYGTTTAFSILPARLYVPAARMCRLPPRMQRLTAGTAFQKHKTIKKQLLQSRSSRPKANITILLYGTITFCIYTFPAYSTRTTYMPCARSLLGTVIPPRLTTVSSAPSGATTALFST